MIELNGLRTKAEMTFQQSKVTPVRNYEEYKGVCDLIRELELDIENLTARMNEISVAGTKISIGHSILLLKNAVNTLRKRSKKYSDIEDAGKKYDADRAAKTEATRASLEQKRSEKDYRSSHPQVPTVAVKETAVAPTVKQPEGTIIEQPKRMRGRPKKVAVAA